MTDPSLPVECGPLELRVRTAASREECLAAAAALMGVVGEVDDPDAAQLLARRAMEFEQQAEQLAVPVEGQDETRIADHGHEFAVTSAIAEVILEGPGLWDGDGVHLAGLASRSRELASRIRERVTPFIAAPVRAEADAELERAMHQRDEAEEWADKLALAIAPESVIGEHSSANNPWANALQVLVERDERVRAEAVAEVRKIVDDFGVKWDLRHEWRNVEGRTVGLFTRFAGAIDRWCDTGSTVDVIAGGAVAAERQRIAGDESVELVCGLIHVALVSPQRVPADALARRITEALAAGSVPAATPPALSEPGEPGALDQATPCYCPARFNPHPRGAVCDSLAKGGTNVVAPGVPR